MWSEYKKLNYNRDWKIESWELSKYLDDKHASTEERQKAWAKFRKYDFNKDGMLSSKDVSDKAKDKWNNWKNWAWGKKND